MSYMPAELDEDDFDDEFLLTDCDPSSSRPVFDLKSDPPFANQQSDATRQHSRSISFQNGNDNNNLISRNTVNRGSKPWHSSNTSKSPLVSASIATARPDQHSQFRLSQAIPSWGSNILTEEDLKLSAIKGNVDIVKQCLLQGIPVNQVLQSGWTALMYASNHSKVDVVNLLLQEGADPNYHVDLYMPLMCACCTSVITNEKLDCVKLLVKAGAEINAKDRQHSTALMLSSLHGYLDIVSYLIENHAKVNQQDARGWTALTWATQRGHKKVVIALLEAGADVNIQHNDRLTVKDLAAHSTSDEMLALLERRPMRVLDGGDMTSTGIVDQQDSAFYMDGNNAVVSEETDKVKTTDLRYGEMEIFLLGLNLPHLVPVFKKHLIDLFLLLDMTEQDLINAGIEQVGARKKILDAARAVHKKNWETSSLVSLHFNKCISCADAVAMVANASKHIRYINSTVVYIKEQLAHHPHSIVHATDQASPTQLIKRLAGTSKHVQILQSELVALEKQLSQEMKLVNIDPPDLITSHKPDKNLKPLQVFLTFTGVLTLTIGCLFAWRNYKSLLEKVNLFI